MYSVKRQYTEIYISFELFIKILLLFILKFKFSKMALTIATNNVGINYRQSF
jgi:hypothetical protein